jgi:hypothetical protein
MEGLARRLNDDASYGTSINNIYKVISFKSPENGRILEKVNPFTYSGSGTKASDNVIKVNKGSMFTMKNPDNNNIIDFYEVTDDIRLDINIAAHKDSSIDNSSYIHGKNYYVYLVFDKNESEPKFLLSLNSTSPSTSNGSYSTYRKIGGFHVGTIRCTTPGTLEGWTGGVPIGTDGEEFGTNWEENVLHECIIHNSIWDLGFRPKCKKPGFAFTRAGIWVSIYTIGDGKVATGAKPNSLKRRNNATSDSTFYLKSPNAGGPDPVSEYGKLPLTGAEGTNAINASQLARQMGSCRLMTYHEWIAGAFGSPQATASGNDNAWANASGRLPAGCAVTTSGTFSTSGNAKYAVSADNITQCVGNVWEYLSDITFDIDGGSSTVSGDSVTTWTWANLTAKMEGDFYGGVRCGLAGGNWAASTRCGGFTFDGDTSVLAVTGGGCRFASDLECSISTH